MPLYSTILAFDTTGTNDSISLYHKGATTSKALPAGGSQLQSSILVPSFQALLQDQGLTFKDVSVLATVSGPGSFTGIRIGLATAQGLLIAGGFRPVVPTLLELLAFAAAKGGNPNKILSLVDSKRGDYFAQIFMPDLAPCGEACPMSIAEIQELAPQMTVVSQAVVPISLEVFIPKKSIAELLIEFCLEVALTENSSRYQTVAPFYIRHPEFKKQKRFLEEK